jgi:hypothetical protein
MYVIFPADEVILLSYGIAQNPRLYQSRPTLDRLKEPIVPISTGTRPSQSTTSSSSIIKNTNNLLDNNNNYLQPQSNHLHVRLPPTSSTNIKRDPSPSVSFADDFMNKSRSSIVDENLFRTTTAGDNNNTDAKNKKSSKLKSKISKISLGKLGKVSSSNEQLEATPSSTRVTEDLQIRVANPTFTRDNLRQKNFDAFFASGEPVYSVERKENLNVDNSSSSLLTPLTPQSIATSSSFDNYYLNTPPTTPQTQSSSSPASPSSNLPPIPSPRSRRGSSIGFSSPIKLFSSSKQSSSTNSAGSNGTKRPKSNESYRTLSGDSLVKGERCPRLNSSHFVFFV